ncbi:MAG: AAA family ATPase [Nanoarchaeota archaeon]
MTIPSKALSSEDKKLLYSESVSLDPETENKLLADSLERLEAENRQISYALSKLEEESSTLRQLFHNANQELTNLKKPALLVAEVASALTGNKAIIKFPNGNKFYCQVMQEVKELQTGDAVLVDQRTLNVIEKTTAVSSFDAEKFVNIQKPTETWEFIGGLKEQIREVKEVIELPLTKPAMFERVGIQPPKGILLYGPPGTGKTLVAKVVAQSTNAMFIEVVGSELVQKFIGEGAKLVKDIFAFARNKAPAIVFIDEVDAIAAMRMENGTSGEREVNRTFMQLLAEIDGFDCLGNVKVIAATNRADILDQALLRPGRLERLIEIGLPNEEGILEILKIHTRKMNLQKVKLKDLVKLMLNFSGAEIKAACTEAGYGAIRDNRDYVNQKDFVRGIEKVRLDEEEEGAEELFG